MKKRLLVVMSLVLAMGLVACGSKETSVDSDAERIAELEKELEELKAQQAEEVEEQEEVVEETEVDGETWTDDTIIAFTDRDMLEKVREITGVTERDITYGDVKYITEFNSGTIGYSNIEPIKYFTSLKVLTIGSESGIEPIGNLINLEKINITCIGETDNIDAIANLKSVKELWINGNKLKDISAVGHLPNIEKLTLNCCYLIEDINWINKCSKLETIDFSSCNSLTDIEIISELPNVKNVIISGCDNIASADFVNKMALEYVNIYGCEKIEDIKIGRHPGEAAADM